MMAFLNQNVQNKLFIGGKLVDNSALRCRGLDGLKVSRSTNIKGYCKIDIFKAWYFEIIWYLSGLILRHDFSGIQSTGPAAGCNGSLSNNITGWIPLLENTMCNNKCASKYHKAASGAQYASAIRWMQRWIYIFGLSVQFPSCSCSCPKKEEIISWRPLWGWRPMGNPGPTPGMK